MNKSSNKLNDGKWDQFIYLFLRLQAFSTLVIYFNHKSAEIPHKAQPHSPCEAFFTNSRDTRSSCPLRSTNSANIPQVQQCDFIFFPCLFKSKEFP